MNKEVSEFRAVSGLKSLGLESLCIRYLLKSGAGHKERLWVLGYLRQSQLEIPDLGQASDAVNCQSELFSLAFSILRLGLLSTLERSMSFLRVGWRRR